MLLPTLGPSSLPVLVAQRDKRHANRTASVLEYKTDTVHTTSGSNEEEPLKLQKFKGKRLSISLWHQHITISDSGHNFEKLLAYNCTRLFKSWHKKYVVGVPFLGFRPSWDNLGRSCTCRISIYFLSQISLVQS